MNEKYKADSTEVKPDISKDTIQINPFIKNDSIQQESKFIIPLRYINESFEFQVNSEIRYFTFSNFVIEDARKMFFQAWMNEKELSGLTALTDSLRKEYIQAQNERKNEISAQILNHEKQSIKLNQDITDRYEKARILEAEYWKTASFEDKRIFQEEIKNYKDSIKSVADIHVNELKKSETQLDTLVLFRPISKSKEAKTTTASGIIYKIQIAAFKNRMPDWADKAIKKLSLLRKVETYTDEKGVKIYTTGNLKTWTEAVTLQKQVKQEGIRNPSIAAYENNIRIPVNEARRKNNEL